MPDQLLRAHEMMEYVYNVADVAYPVSIRDQMNRARWIVQKAYDLGFFGPTREREYRKLLVCGAGAAGATAALHAVNLGVSTVLVERSAAPFLRQRLCTSRWIDPTQYDWPADDRATRGSLHWDRHSFPYPPSPPMPLPWGAARSHRLALAWLVRLRAALAAAPPGTFTFRSPDHVTSPPTPVPPPPAKPLGVQVTFASRRVETFGMVLWCTGFGDERRAARRIAPPPVAAGAVTDYLGFAFWETDPFERPDWGVTGSPEGLHALVSGGGDGALQDLIRLTTRRKSAFDVFDELKLTGWSMPEAVRHALFTAEDQAQRALLWCQPGTPEEHRTLQTLHDAYVTAVGEVLDPGQKDSKKLSDAVKGILAANPHPVLLVHPCTHFARGYGLNHFLALLLLEVARRGGLSGPEVRSQRGLRAVSGHACAGSPWGCHGFQHTVHIQQRPLCYQPALPLMPEETVDTRVLVVRHGIAPAPAFAGTPLAFARQVMPYHHP